MRVQKRLGRKRESSGVAPQLEVPNSQALRLELEIKMSREKNS